MERNAKKTSVRIFKMLGGAACLLLGLYFSTVGVLCQYVDGVHVLGYTLLPALALLCFFLAWLCLRQKKGSRKGDSPARGEDRTDSDRL